MLGYESSMCILLCHKPCHNRPNTYEQAGYGIAPFSPGFFDRDSGIISASNNIASIPHIH